jgi:thioredoxin 1
MNIIYATDDNFENLISKGTVLVDMFASWCGPCQMISPILEELQKEIDVQIIKVDVDKCGNTARKYGVMSIPTLILFKDGKEFKRQMGMMPKEMLKDFINE